ncbi:hypothetical protein D9619_012924 [Psilocybe cf. subviscida]|uniref:Uncharacterized protein n=1 Tax=Psilocybe cf. subviscida TaxID=2480587 RepID=A0A8H5F4V8_9AGAR|nr:hypothetical protein D9619_012924 [Psilocybe cf. subviscida]
MEDFLESWKKPQPFPPSRKTVDWIITSLGLHAEILDSIGHTASALNAIHRASKMAGLYYERNLCLPMLVCEYRRANLMTTLGFEQEALSAAEKALKLTREMSSALDKENLVSALHAVAIAADRCLSYQRVIEVSEEALYICQQDNKLALKQGYPSPCPTYLTLMPRSAQLLSFGCANNAMTVLGLQYATDAVQYAINLRGAVTLGTGPAAQSYFEARGSLANILISTGDVYGATAILQEQRKYFNKQVEVRNGDYRA